MALIKVMASLRIDNLEAELKKVRAEKSSHQGGIDLDIIKSSINGKEEDILKELTIALEKYAEILRKRKNSEIELMNVLEKNKKIKNEMVGLISTRSKSR